MVQAFCDTLDTARGRIHVVRVRPLSCCLWPPGSWHILLCRARGQKPPSGLKAMMGRGARASLAPFPARRVFPSVEQGDRKLWKLGVPARVPTLPVTGAYCSLLA